MAHYFLHLRSGEEELLDPDGGEYENQAQLQRAVLANAREIIAASVLEGVIDLSLRIDAEDTGGSLVYSLQFSDAVIFQVKGV